MNKEKILVLRSGALGDFVCTLPALMALRNWRPEAYIEIVARSGMAELAVAAGLADAGSSVDGAWVARLFLPGAVLSQEEIARLRSFTIAVSYLQDPSESVAENLRAAGVGHLITGSPIVKDMHACDQLLKPLRNAGIPVPREPVPRLELKPEHRQRGRARLEGVGKRVVAIHAGSGSPRKNWPVHKFMALAATLESRMGVTPFFTVGEADSEVAAAVRNSSRAFTVLQDCSVLELAETLSACVAFVGNDSGVTHLAAALGVPVVALFGPTDPAIWGPRGSHVCIVKAACPSSESLAAISVNLVLMELEAVLSGELSKN
mgnify:CR=1 FL=1